jgi:CRP/FNR family transcriptional regulator, cyclic AMP receptor protein
VPIAASLLAGLSAQELQSILQGARRRRYERGEVVFRGGDPGANLHVVTQGRFVVRTESHQGHSVALAIVGPGELFGELEPLREEPTRLATVAALEPGETVAIGREDLDALRATRPAVTDFLLSILAERISAYTHRLLEALHLPADHRVLLRLLELRDIYREEGCIPLKQADLADMAGTSRATVNRVLNEEESRGAVRLTRGRIEVLDAETLRRRVRAAGDYAYP